MQQSNAKQYQLDKALERQGKLEIQLKEKSKALENLREATLDWREVCILLLVLLTMVFIMCTGEPDVRAAAEDRVQPAYHEAAAGGGCQVGGGDAYGADDCVDECKFFWLFFR